MGSVVDGLHSSLLESLPARPPTPPRETKSSHGLDSLPKQVIAPQQLGDHLRSLQTPPGVSSPSSSSTSSTARRKRVGFSSQAQYQEPPSYTDKSSRKQQATPVSLPSSTSRPVKSILKPTATANRLPPVTAVSLDGDKPGQINIADMLESSLQQLAGADRESKVDAYTMLFRGLKASSNLPDRIAMQEKMGLFMQFIQRDLTAKSPNGNLDILLITSALKLLHTLLHFHGIASGIPNDFGIFIVDHCIRSFDDEHAPKEVVRHLMQALYLQNFPSEVMTFERVGRLVTALHDIENHLIGKSVVQGRIHVYEKLVKQCPQQMAIHSHWLQDLFTDMLSSVTQIRSSATKFGLNAAFALNKDKRLVNQAVDLLNLSLDEKKYIEHVAERLNTMLLNKDESVLVPRIWSVATLLIPNPHQWDYFPTWVLIIQRSFNHSNHAVRKEANMAWSCFTYRLHLDRRLDHKSVIGLVRRPLLMQSNRKAIRDYVLGGICNLYYYALRPDMNLQMLDEIWDSSVAPCIQRLIDHGQDDHAHIVQATAILTGLLDCKTRRIWREDRITDLSLIKDNELPAIESKWIRANSTRVFELAGPVLMKGLAELSISGSPSQNLWRALVYSVASASAKDVKLHDETANFVARSFTFLQEIWSNGAVDGKLSSSVQFLDAAKEFVSILIQGLGLLPNPFLDKHFIQTKGNQFILHSSSNRSGKSQGSRRVPLHHLFLILSRLPTGVADDETFAQFFEAVFAPFFHDKGEKAQADLAQDLLRLLPMEVYCPYGPWSMCAARISASIEHSQYTHSNSGSSSGGNLGPEFREMIRVLERGLKSFPRLPWQHWNHLFQSLSGHARNEIGDAGVAIAVIEPLASILKDMVAIEKAEAAPANWIESTIELLAASTHPRDKQAVDAARRRLWGTSNAGIRNSSFDPFDKLYILLAHVQEHMYRNIGFYEHEHAVQLLGEIGGFFDRGNPQLNLRTLAAIQDGLVHWLQDEDHRFNKSEFPLVADATRYLWQKLCNILIRISADHIQLNTIEPLWCAAFRSTHRDIVRIASETWNRIFEDVQQIEYPQTLKAALVSLGSSVDIIRPGLAISNQSDDLLSYFTESQGDGNTIPTISPTKLHPTPRTRSEAYRRSATPGSTKAPESSRSIGATPLTRSKPNGRTPRLKPRHEDSQLHFSPIDAPPALVAQDSQILTEHQKEIRDRQRETAAFFPDLRSSPTEKTKKARSTAIQSQKTTAQSGAQRASTPEREGEFKDVLGSTPTPRRGQPILLPEQDQEMTDPPSSPPEPRGYRLLAELKSQANNTNSLDEWQFSSSPISGSPVPNHQTIPATQPMELDNVGESHLDDGDGAVADDVEVIQQDVTSSQLEDDAEVIEDTAMLGQKVEMAPPTIVFAEHSVHQKLPITPSGRQLRSKAAHMTPRSENEEFVDAPTSPLPPTPSRRAAIPGSSPMVLRKSPRNSANSQSFAISASFEKDLRNVGTGRIEIPLRSSRRKTDYRSYEDILPESPEQLQEQAAQQAQDEAEAMDSIEVGGTVSKKARRRRTRKSKRASIPQSPQLSKPLQLSVTVQNSQVLQGTHGQIPSTPINELAALESQESFENVSPGSGRWWRKRKRSVSSVQSSGGSKRHRYQDVLARDEVPDSQPAAPADQEHHTETQTAGGICENDVSFHNSSPHEQQASQEIPVAHANLSQEAQLRSDIPISDVAEQTDDEDAVQSQLIREEEAASIEEVVPLSSEAGNDQQVVETNSPPETLPEADDENDEEVEVEAEQRAAESGPSKFDSLMALLRNGLDSLRATNLSREQFHQVDDVFFEMRRELFEAERRGKK